MDLFVGNYTISKEEGAELRCPLDKNRDWKYLTVRIAELIFRLVRFKKTLF